MADENQDPVRDSAVRVFTYLKELAQLKAHKVRDLGSYEHVIWFHEVPDHPGCRSMFSGNAEEQDDVWMDVQRRRLPEMPAPPAICREWVEAGDEPSAEPRLKDVIVEKADVSDSHPPQDDVRERRLGDHPEVTAKWQEYIENDWRPWARQYAQWGQADALYRKLFMVHRDIERLGEQYELVIGLGLLTWQTPNNQLVRRHVLVGDACLYFDARGARISVKGAEEGIKLRFEADMLELQYQPSVDDQREAETLLEPCRESPGERAELGETLRAWIHSVAPNGAYSDVLLPPEAIETTATVTLAPALILRPRTERNQVQFFAAVADQIKKGCKIPRTTRGICESGDDFIDSENAHEPANVGGTEDSTLYLPLPVNDEQIQIVQSLSRRRGIIVQGPPGTGKSHTIANLVCHLLAKGKRILVTSQTPRALKVLKDKMPEGIQDLCVTLLGNDQTARQELERSVQSLNRHHAEWNPKRSADAIEGRDQELFETRKHIAHTQRLLREEREKDSFQHQIDGTAYSGTAQQVAVSVGNDKTRLGWIPDRFGPEQPCQLSNSEFAELVSLYRKITPDDCRELGQLVVKPERLPDVAQFIVMVDREKRTREELAARGTRPESVRLHVLIGVEDRLAQELPTAVSDLLSAVAGMTDVFPWAREAVSDVLSGNDAVWGELHTVLATRIGGLKESVSVAQSVDLRTPAGIDRKRLKNDAKHLGEHFQSGGRVGWWIFSPEVVRRNRYLLKDVLVNGRPCSDCDQLTLLGTYLDVVDELDYLWSLFEGRDKREPGAIMVEVGHLSDRLQYLERLSELKGRLDVAKRSVAAIRGLSQPDWRHREELEGLILDIEFVRLQRAYASSVAAITEAMAQARTFQSHPQAHSLNSDIVSALATRDPAALAKCLEQLEGLEKKRELIARRDQLWNSLRAAAPRLAADIQASNVDTMWDKRVDEFEQAWAWARAQGWLSRFIGEHNRAQLDASLEQLTIRERKLVAEMAALKAWAACLTSLTPIKRQNLQAWATMIKKIGKGTGKYAGTQRRQAQSFLDECKDAIPAWIMPLYRVFETVAPNPEAFDVIIIDEASQTGPEGMAIMYLGKQCIVVGDSEQISPSAVGIDLSDVESLIKKHLQGIPFKDFFGPTGSLFGYAAIRFGGRIVLREHFRCMPEIIEFSNQLCYAATPLRPLRQYPAARRLDPVLVYHVKDGFREGSVGNVVNRAEANALVHTMVDFCSRREYADKTMGVISLQGEAQAKYIESKLLEQISARELQIRRIVCGDAYAFQGDERDIIFLSMVAAPNEKIGALVRETDKQRFNVAASRGKDQVVLFHTATLNELNLDCMRYHLLKYYLNPTRPSRDTDLSRCQSEFERDVARSIIGAGYRVVPQYEFAGYFIDLVVEGQKSSLAVECDGDEWHGIEQYERDTARQRILERSGWRFWRIRGCEYYRDPVDSLKSLWATLEQMGIKPISQTSTPAEQVVSGTSEGITTSQLFCGDPDEPVAGPELDIDKEKVSKLQESENREEPVPKPKREYRRRNPVNKADGGERLQVDGPDDVGTSSPHEQPDYLGLARWGKESGALAAWERSLIFSVGKYLAQGWKLTDKMEQQRVRILKKARDAGFKDEPPPGAASQAGQHPMMP